MRLCKYIGNVAKAFIENRGR